MPQLEILGMPMYVEDQGQGPVVLAVHGFPLHSGMWNRQVKELPHYRWIVPDLPGFGRSKRGTSPLTMNHFAEVLHQVLETLQVSEPVIYMGLSMGGYIGWRFFAKNPSRVQAMVVCDSKPQADTPEQVENRLQSAKKVRAGGFEEFTSGLLEKLISPHARQYHPPIVAELDRMLGEADAESVALALEGMAERPDSVGLLSEIQIPTLVLAGEDDALTPVSAMKVWSQQLPNVKTAVISNAGHMAPMENSDEVNAELKSFFQSLE